MVSGLLVYNPIAIRDVTGQMTALELALQVSTRKANGNNHLGSIPIATEPVGIDPTHGDGQAIRRAVQVERSSLAIVPRENTRARLILGGESRVNSGNDLNQVWPANALGKAVVYFLRHIPQGRVDGRNRQQQQTEGHATRRQG